MPPRKNGLRSFAFHRDESGASPALALSLAARPGHKRLFHAGIEG